MTVTVINEDLLKNLLKKQCKNDNTNLTQLAKWHSTDEMTHLFSNDFG